MDRMIHCRAWRARWTLAVPPARTRRSTREHHLLPGRRGDPAARRCSTAAGTDRAATHDRRQPAPARRPLPGARVQHPHPGAAVLRGAAHDDRASCSIPPTRPSARRPTSTPAGRTAGSPAPRPRTPPTSSPRACCAGSRTPSRGRPRSSTPSPPTTLPTAPPILALPPQALASSAPSVMLGRDFRAQTMAVVLGVPAEKLRPVGQLDVPSFAESGPELDDDGLPAGEAQAWSSDEDEAEADAQAAAAWMDDPQAMALDAEDDEDVRGRLPGRAGGRLRRVGRRRGRRPDGLRGLRRRVRRARGRRAARRRRRRTTTTSPRPRARSPSGPTRTATTSEAGWAEAEESAFPAGADEPATLSGEDDYDDESSEPTRTRSRRPTPYEDEEPVDRAVRGGRLRRAVRGGVRKLQRRCGRRRARPGRAGRGARRGTARHPGQDRRPRQARPAVRGARGLQGRLAGRAGPARGVRRLPRAAGPDAAAADAQARRGRVPRHARHRRRDAAGHRRLGHAPARGRRLRAVPGRPERAGGARLRAPDAAARRRLRARHASAASPWWSTARCDVGAREARAWIARGDLADPDRRAAPAGAGRARHGGRARVPARRRRQARRRLRRLVRRRRWSPPCAGSAPPRRSRSRPASR